MVLQWQWRYYLRAENVTGRQVMWQWLAKNWGWLLASIVIAGYFACYVLAMRHQRSPHDPDKPKLPCDRC